MKTTALGQALLDTLREFRAALHQGPGPHASGSPQSVHGGGANPAAKPPKEQMAFDFDTPADDAPWIGQYLPTSEWVAKAEARARETTGYERTWDRTRSDWVVYTRSPEEVREILQQATAHLRELNEQGRLIVRRGRQGAMGVLSDGRFKTQFETGMSGGAYDPGYRKEGEARGLGIPEDINVAERPVYGYIEVPDGSNAENYGPVQFVMKPEVKRRTTITVGDSLGRINDGDVVGTPALDPGYGSVGGNAGRLAKGEAPHGYIEAQIQGGVTLADVEEIVFTRDAFRTRGEDNRPLAQPELTEVYARIVDRVKSKGIRYRLAPEET